MSFIGGEIVQNDIESTTEIKLLEVDLPNTQFELNKLDIIYSLLYIYQAYKIYNCLKVDISYGLRYRVITLNNFVLRVCVALLYVPISLLYDTYYIATTVIVYLYFTLNYLCCVTSLTASVVNFVLRRSSQPDTENRVETIDLQVITPISDESIPSPNTFLTYVDERV